MADAATLIVLVATGEATDATTRAMARATREALGPSAHVIVHETTGEPADADVAEVERAENPDAVVELSWAASHEGRHRQASVRMHLKTGRWVDRWITFRPTDADAERGRTLGFAIASILPEESVGSPAPGSSAPAPSSGPPPASTAPEVTAVSPPVPSTPPAPSGSSGSPPPPSAAPPSAPPPEPPPRSVPRAAAPPEAARPEPVERNSVVSGDVGGIWFWDKGAGGYGALVSAEYFFLPGLAARAGGSLRFGTINNSADLPFHVWSLFGGLALQPIRPRLSQRFGLSIRASWIFELEEISRTGGLDQPTQAPAAKWNYGPELALEGEFLIAPDVVAVLGAGAEWMLRSSTVNVAGHPVSWWPVRPFGQAGFRIRF
jgi:hypothetical protein